jgi:hypothetical protein
MATLVGQKKGKKIDVSTDGQRLVYKATREYLVYDSTGVDGEGDILSTSGLPSVNLAYTFDGAPVQLVCKSKSAQQWEDNNRYWTVTAEYDNEPQNTEQNTGGNEGDSGDPTTWYAIVRVDFESYEETLWNEINFAKRPYATPLTVNKAIPVLKFTQYMPPDETIGSLLAYHDVVNTSRFLLRGDKGDWLLTISAAEFGVTNGYECWKVSFELRFKRTRIPGSILVYDEDGNDITNVTGAFGYYEGWQAYIPQMETIDINKRPFTDIFENSGDTGKIDTDGLFLSDQDEPFIVKQHIIRDAIDFSFLRIRQ